MSEKNKIHFNKTPEEVLRDRKQRQSDKLKLPRVPLGGAPPVRIPPLNSEPIEKGGTMNQ